MKKSIIDFIKRNRVSSTQIADCMGKHGAIFNANAVNRGHFSVGNLFYVYAANETNWDIHKAIEKVEDGDIVFVEETEGSDKALFGDLVSKYLLLYKQAGAIVTNGLLRDAPRLIKENWKIWCKGFTPVGFSNDYMVLSDKQKSEAKLKSEYYHGSIAVCDDTGVVVIPQEFHTQEFLDQIVAIEELEDTWFDAIDRKKYSTFETVCLKKYLQERE